MTRKPDVYSLGQGVTEPKAREAIQQLERLMRRVLEDISASEETVGDIVSGVSSVTGTGLVTVTPTAGDVVVSVNLSGYVPVTRSISTTAPLSGGGALSSDLTLSILDNGITDTLLRDSVGLSVIGRASNTLGDPADIVAGSDGDILRRSGTTLGFGSALFSKVNGLTPGSVVFAGASGELAQDNANLFWNDSTNQLSITSTLGAGIFGLTVRGPSGGIRTIVDSLSGALNFGTTAKEWTWYPSGTGVNLFEYTTTLGSGGSDRLFVAAGGNVGIGATPTNLLTVKKSLPGATLVDLCNTSATGFTELNYQNAAAQTRLSMGYDNANSRAFIAVHNGTTQLNLRCQANALFSIHGDADGVGSDVGYTGLSLVRGSGAGTELWYIGRNGVAGNDGLIFRRTSSTNDLTIDTSGNFSIGSSLASNVHTITGFTSINASGIGQLRLGDGAGNHYTLGRDNNVTGNFQLRTGPTGGTLLIDVTAAGAVSIPGNASLGNAGTDAHSLLGTLNLNATAGSNGQIAQVSGGVPVWGAPSTAGIVSGTGTSGRSARWTSATAIGTGAFTDDGTNVSIGGNITVGSGITLLASTAVINTGSVAATGTASAGNSLHVVKGTSTSAAAYIAGTQEASYFHVFATEDTYIRAGKFAGAIIIGDTNTGGIYLGSGTNTTVVSGNVSVAGNVTVGGGTVHINVPNGSQPQLRLTQTGQGDWYYYSPGGSTDLNIFSVGFGVVSSWNYTTAAMTQYGALSVNGNATLGNATSDSHTINGSLSVAAGANNITLDGGSIDFAIGSTNKVAITSGSVAINIDATIGDTTSRSHTINGLTTVFGPAANHTLWAKNTNTGRTTNDTIVVLGQNLGSFDATAAARNSYAGYFENLATRSAGANNVVNNGLFVDVNGAQENYAIRTYRGDNRFNESSGSSRFYGAVTIDGNATVGNASTDTHLFNGAVGMPQGLSLNYITTYDVTGGIYLETGSGINCNITLETDKAYVGDPSGSQDGDLWIRGAVHNTREFVAPQITADQNNYNPTASGVQWDASHSSILYVNSDAARNITGLVNSTSWSGRHVWMYNTGAFNITLVHQSASSSAGYRFQGVNNANVVLQPKQGVHLYLSAQMSGEWIVLA